VFAETAETGLRVTELGWACKCVTFCTRSATSDSAAGSRLRC